ncbi:MAG: hypothetical protein A2984_02125 [Omnitrophica WOR_2 bacterium RIFCSPLOWO2_01_FULL_41_12]|nr:MAG: hypothetical protein A2984_02125 [Omnitrophica WOR_2 bacterium RIFCSPLOWO2_01_FULL_41_12]
MRDLLFKNLTSQDRKRKIIASSEIVDRQGVRSIVRRHFICTVREIHHNQMQKPQPYLYVLKEHNTKEQQEKFFCRIKGSIYAVSNGRLFLIHFMHSLKISLKAISQDLIQYSE